MMDLDFYKSVFHKIAWEGGLGEYVHSYAGADTFADDPELQKAFILAKDGLLRFEELLEERIYDLGGNLDD